MQDELAARHRAITLRLAGQSVNAICAAVGRSDRWFHKWWRRYFYSRRRFRGRLTSPFETRTGSAGWDQPA